jgi:hypothetical protein
LRSLFERQEAFAGALLQPARRAPPGCTGPDRLPDEKRFAVYRNNVIVSLVEALKDGFPAVCRLLGEDCFRAVARVYAVREPPLSPIMLAYGAGFPDFLSRFEPLAAIPYLPDVARIERAWLEAYHAAEATALDPGALVEIPAQQAAAIRFALHPSVRIVRSPYPALSLWHSNIGEGVADPIDLRPGAQSALIVRPDAEVEVRAIPADAADFLQALLAGQSVAQAAETVMSAHAGFELADHLAALLDGGLVVGYSIDSNEA